MKLNRIPTGPELARLRERWEREDADEIKLKDFDTTHVAGIEGTINQLGLFIQRSGKTVEEKNTEVDALRQINAALKSHASKIEELTTTMNTKAPKSAMRKLAEDLTAKHVRSVDNLFKLVAAGVAILGALIAYKGHS